MAEKQTASLSTSGSIIPSVLACGYRQIKISKTSNTFPVFLVALPNQTKYAVWRSKRDFLLLGRTDRVTLPKSALKKLAETVPWKRPNVDFETKEKNAANYYHPRMKKSLMQLDQFLQAVAAYSSDSSVKQAWERFCRPGDTDFLVSLEDDSHSKQNNDNSTTTTEQRSSQLGQYFCSDENAKCVVDWVMKKIRPFLNLDNLLFLEPSCGHGDIIQELVNQLDATTNVSPGTISMLGYDIDHNAIRACKLLPASKYHTVYICKNFLETRCSLYDTCCIPPRVICLGGPPYTTGAGSGSDIQRDLPVKFIDHCTKEYKASVICFLLPTRYRDCVSVPEGFQQETLELNSSTFFFQGKTPVTQPSIIQCLYSVEEAI
jgi:hypothetical protein